MLFLTSLGHLAQHGKEMLNKNVVFQLCKLLYEIYSLCCGKGRCMFLASGFFTFALGKYYKPFLLFL